MESRRALPPRTHGARAGFTLVELLVALTLLGLIALLVTGALSFGARSWERTAARSSAINETVAVQNFLRQRIAAMEAGRLAAGTADGLSFRAPWLGALAGGGTYDYALTIIPDDDLFRLEMTWEPRDSLAEGLSDGRTLLTQIRSANFSYFGDRGETGESGWHETWTDGARLPELVALELVFADPARRWPRFTVALRHPPYG